MPELADIFRRYGSEYIERYGDRMLSGHLKAFYDILECRTEAMGGHIEQCDNSDCGYTEYKYHLCRNRNCPKCQGEQSKDWLEKRSSELLPVKYFHIVFTLPKELQPFIRSNQKKLLSALMTAAAQSLIKIAGDQRYEPDQIFCWKFREKSSK